MITAAAGTEIKSADDLTNAITETGADQDLDLHVRRGADQLDITVTVGSRDA